MATKIPYLAVASKSLAALQQDQLIYTVPNTWIIHINSMYWISDGDFNLNGIQDNSGRGYTNAIQSTPIPSDFLQSPQTAYLSIRDFIIPIDLEGGKIWQANVQDTSNSTNVITVVLNCIAEIPS